MARWAAGVALVLAGKLTKTVCIRPTTGAVVKLAPRQCTPSCLFSPGRNSVYLLAYGIWLLLAWLLLARS